MPFEICRYRGQPLDDHNQILWSTEPQVAVYATATPQSRTRMLDEQTRFVIEAVTSAPVRQLVAVARHSASQFLHIETGAQPRQARDAWTMTISREAPEAAPILTNAAAFAGTVPWGAINALHGASVVFAALFLGIAIVRSRPLALRGIPVTARSPRQHAWLALLVVFAVLLAVLALNAALCGGLSGPSARYQVRLVWLVPLLAAAWFLRGTGDLQRGPAASHP